jgi:hypothetical protein
VLSRAARRGDWTIASIVAGYTWAKLPDLSLKESSAVVDADMLLRALSPDKEPLSKRSCEVREPTRVERLKVESCLVVTIEAQREERGRRSATIVSATVPASGKVSASTYSRTAKTASQVS